MKLEDREETLQKPEEKLELKGKARTTQAYNKNDPSVSSFIPHDTIKLSLFRNLVTECETILNCQPNNRCCKFLIQYIESGEAMKLTHEEMTVFFKCIKSGLDNPDSSIGCYAMTPTDYSTFKGFFDSVVEDYHGNAVGKEKHVFGRDSWSTPEDCDFELKKLVEHQTTLHKPLSMRVRVARNLVGFNLPGAMSKDERICLEQDIMLPVFEVIKKKWGGTVYSLTPDFGPEGPNPNLIDSLKYQELVEEHVMFKDMSSDPYLKSAGIANHWPYGRGCWQSHDKMHIIWYGEEDHLRIICMKKGFQLQEIFANLRSTLLVLEGSAGIEFAKDEYYGYITSCPSNLGTAMRASVHLKIPNILQNGPKVAKDVCKRLGLSVRGPCGEHTQLGIDGTVDISPSVRLLVRESEIISKLYEGLEKLIQLERSYAYCSARKAKIVNVQPKSTFNSAIEKAKAA